MSCCCEDGVKVSKMALELKSGQMLHYKRRIFGKNWREVFVVLHNDSTLAWYKNKSQLDQEGGVMIKNAPDLLAFGQFTSMIPNMPELPESYTQKELLALGTRSRGTVYWFLCPTEQELESWMIAIGNTLPPPPNMPQMQPIYTQEAVAPPTPAFEEQGMPPQTVPPTALPLAVPSGPQNLPPPYHMQQPGPMGIPGQYPTPTYGPPYAANPPPPPYLQSARVQPASNTTVVVQDRRNDGGDFAMGMMMGGAIGYGWGHGLGWGHGWGGGGWHHHGGATINDNDVTINNYYDVDNTVVNNDINVDASNDMAIIAGDVDYGGDFGGGGDFDIGMF